MQVRILKISVEPLGKITVGFDCLSGKGHGFWVGHPPIKGEHYEVEIDIADVLNWGEDIARYSGESDEPLNGDATCLLGQLDSIDENGVAAIRLENGVILVETRGEACNPNCEVRITPSTLSLHETQI